MGCDAKDLGIVYGCLGWARGSVEYTVRVVSGSSCGHVCFEAGEGNPLVQDPSPKTSTGYSYQAVRVLGREDESQSGLKTSAYKHTRPGLSSVGV